MIDSSEASTTGLHEMKYNRIIVLKAKLDSKWKNYTEIKKKKSHALVGKHKAIQNIGACFRAVSCWRPQPCLKHRISF